MPGLEDTQWRPSPSQRRQEGKKGGTVGGDPEVAARRDCVTGEEGGRGQQSACNVNK